MPCIQRWRTWLVRYASGLAEVALEAEPPWCWSLHPVNLERVWSLAMHATMRAFTCMTYAREQPVVYSCRTQQSYVYSSRTQQTRHPSM